MPLKSKYKSIIELGLLLGSAIIMAIALLVGNTIFFGHPPVSVTTGSMLPIYNGFQDDVHTEIHPFRGDILLVKKVPIESIEIGDVIIFDTPSVSESVVHRVVSKWQENGEYIFKTNGDNNKLVDSWEVHGDKVHGIVVLRIPHVGWFLLTFQTTLGKIIILALAVLILFMGDDSEEDAPLNEEEQDVHQQDSNSLISYVKKIGMRIIQKKSYLYTLFAFIILFLFLGSNLLSSFLYPPSINLYRFDDESRIANLITAPTPLSSGDNWKDHSNQTMFFFPIQIEIQSGGIFNNIDRIEICVNETKGIYIWNTVYNFVGTRVFKGAIIAIMNSNSIITASVTVSLYSRGLFASSLKFMTFSISLQSLG